MRLPLAVFLLTTPLLAWGLIRKLDIDQDDRRAFQIESFGFETGGQIKLELSNLELLIAVGDTRYDNKEEGFRLAFLLQRSDNEGSLPLDDSKCLHEEEADTEDTFVISLSSRRNWDKFTWEQRVEVPGYYHLYFSNCEEDTQVSFTLRLEEYNLSNGKRNYLSAGEASLPAWFWALSLLFLVQLGVWIRVLNSNKEHVKATHYLMTVVLALKVLATFAEAFRYHTLAVSGTHDTWSILFYIFSFMRGMLMFAVIVLIGTGWSTLKPFLTERDKQLMLVVLAVQAMVNVAIIVVSEETPGTANWVTWRDILHVLDIVCCLLILLPVIWSIRHLKQAVGEDAKDGKASRTLARLRSFRTFYLAIVSYVYFTRILVFLLEATLPFDYAWVGPVSGELATFAFFCATGYLFRPQTHNPYFLLSTEDEEEELGLIDELPITASSSSDAAAAAAVASAAATAV